MIRLDEDEDLMKMKMKMVKEIKCETGLIKTMKLPCLKREEEEKRGRLFAQRDPEEGKITRTRTRTRDEKEEEGGRKVEGEIIRSDQINIHIQPRRDWTRRKRRKKG